MASYTFQLRELESVEGRDNLKKWFMDYDLHDYLTDEEIQVIRERNTWNESKLADLIIDHYYMREIGLETPAYFKLKLKSAMREIMEEKAPLIYSASISFNPLNEFEVNETSNGYTNGKEERNENTSGIVVESNTPQGQISKSAILNGDYATSTSANENEGRFDTSNNTSSANERKTTGHNTSNAVLIREYRRNIAMINREIINDLASLFIGIY